MRCLTAHRGDVYLAMRGPDSARVNSVSSPRRLRSLTTHRRPIPPHSPRSIPDFYQARDKPIPIGSYKRLPASSCIGNAPAINSTLLLSTTAPSHSRYNTNDFAATIGGMAGGNLRRGCWAANWIVSGWRVTRPVQRIPRRGFKKLLPAAEHAGHNQHEPKRPVIRFELVGRD